MVKFAHLISKEGENNNCYIRYVLWKDFKNCIKLITSPFLVLQNCFTRRALKEQFVTQRTLQGHSKGTQRAFGHSGTRMALRHSPLKALGTWALQCLRHSGTRRALGHLDTRVLKGLGHLRACSSLPTLINVFGMGNILDDVESPMYVFSLPNWSNLHADFINDINVGNILATLT